MYCKTNECKNSLILKYALYILQLVTFMQGLMVSSELPLFGPLHAETLNWEKLQLNECWS